MQKLIITAVVVAIVTALAVTGVMHLMGIDPNAAVVAGITGGVTGAVAVGTARKPKKQPAD